MGGEIDSLDRRTAAGLLGWWLDSGVDVAVGEEPRDWARPATISAPPPPPADQPPLPPGDLEQFRAWLATSAGLPLDRPGARRIAPEGSAGAAIMVLTDVATADDGDRPVGGDALALAIRMLAAIGIAPGDAYWASLGCFALPGARMTPAELEQCAELARRHVALAAPKRLLLLGDGPSKALLGEPVARARGRIHKIEGVRTIATFAPRWLMGRPSDKALAWRDLLLLMEESL